MYNTIPKIGLKRSVDSASEPVTLTEAKKHLVVDHDDDNDYISSLITAARNIAENYTNRSFFTQTWVMYMSNFNSNFCIELKKGIVQSVSSITYYSNDSQETWGSSNYRLINGSDIGYIESVDGYPSSVDDRLDAIEVTYVTGWDDINNIPQAIKQAVLMIVGHLYENRQDVVVGSQVNTIPLASQYLLDPYVIRHFHA